MISCVLLAAGLSSRMEGRNKLLMSLKGKIILAHTLEALLACDAYEVIVVLGYQYKEIKFFIDSNNYEVKTVYNKHFATGSTSSIKAGVEKVSSEADGIMICLADMPFIKSNQYNQIIGGFNQAKQSNPDAIVIPCYHGKRGNPVIFSTTYKSEILSHEKMEGCKGLIKDHQQNVTEIKLDTNCITVDIDTNEEFESARKGLINNS